MFDVNASLNLSGSGWDWMSAQITCMSASCRAAISEMTCSVSSVMPAPSGNVVVGTRIMPQCPEGVGTLPPHGWQPQQQDTQPTKESV